MPRSSDALDAEIEQALRSAPLAAPPPLLYAAVMRDVRAAPRAVDAPRPAFRLSWLDLALSMFAAMMFAATGLLVRDIGAAIPEAPWLDYARLLAVYQLQKLWYLNFALIVWSMVAVALMLVSLVFAAWIKDETLIWG